MSDQEIISADEILKVTEEALAHVRVTCGGKINLKSINLRVWAAAAILNSAIEVGNEPAIMEIFERELEILGAGNHDADGKGQDYG